MPPPDRFGAARQPPLPPHCHCHSPQTAAWLTAPRCQRCPTRRADQLPDSPRRSSPVSVFAAATRLVAICVAAPPHDRGRRLKPDTDAATLIDIGALGGNAP